MNPNKSSDQGCNVQTLHLPVTIKLKYSTYGIRITVNVCVEANGGYFRHVNLTDLCRQTIWKKKVREQFLDCFV